jgi:hypothetical protein
MTANNPRSPRLWSAALAHTLARRVLDGQFPTQRQPPPDEHPITVDVDGRPTEIAAEIAHQLEKRQGTVHAMDLHPEWRRTRTRRQESEDDTAGKRDSELVWRG